MKTKMNVFLGLTVLALSLVILGCGGDDSSSVLSKPKNLVVTAISAYEIEVTWDAVEDAESYNIYRTVGTDETDDASVYDVLGKSDLAYSDTSVGPGTTYYYAVAAVDVYGKEGSRAKKHNEKLLSIDKADGVSLDSFETPADYDPEAAFNSVTIEWSTPTISAGTGSVEGYNIYRVGGGKTIFVAKVPAGTTSFTDSDVSPGTEYTYTIAVIINTGTAGAPDLKESTGVLEIPAKTDVSPEPPKNASVAENITAGSKFLIAGDYDNAIKYYEEAYKTDNKDPAAIVYSSLAKLASIATDTKTQNLFKNRLGVKGYPNQLGKLLTSDWMKPYTEEWIQGYYQWTVEGTNHWAYWYEKGEDKFWTGTGYTDVNKSGYYESSSALIYIAGPTTPVYDTNDIGDGEGEGNIKSIQLDGYWYDWYAKDSVSYYGSTYTFPHDGYYAQTWSYSYTLIDKAGIYQTEISRQPELSVPTWVTGYTAYTESLTSKGLQSTSTWTTLLFANLLDKNTNGLNTLLDEVIDTVFGSNFNEVVSRVAKLSYDDAVALDQTLIDGFGLGDLLEGGVSVGKVELDLLVGALRLVKGTLEWVTSYDWNTNLNFLKFDWAAGFEGGIENLQAISNGDLPLRNNFLKARSNAAAKLVSAKADYLAAIEATINAYDHLAGSTVIPPGVKDQITANSWIKEGLTELKAAITAGSTFGVPNQLPSSGGTWAALDKPLTVNFGKFFTAGQLSVNNLITTEGTGNKIAPVFYGLNYESGEDWSKITDAATIETFDIVGIELNLAPLNELVTGLGFSTDPWIQASLSPDLGALVYGLYHK
ncbi:fibronectin type III domain-containing protein [Treponema primitia]|uniref:fibronectin type III domain-containing protein n=1 Tax=Treponema primitia TaxID=88058 RepID=UPI00025552ED|nr:fibronectin type III domain-containing protein [Treponema primitia]